MSMDEKDKQIQRWQLKAQALSETVNDLMNQLLELRVEYTLLANEVDKSNEDS